MTPELMDTSLGGPAIKYLSSALFFPIFGLTAVLKILSFQALALGDKIANLLQSWRQQPVLQIVALTLSRMQLWFQRSNALSVPLEDPDRGTDEAATCSN